MCHREHTRASRNIPARAGIHQHDGQAIRRFREIPFAGCGGLVLELLHRMNPRGLRVLVVDDEGLIRWALGEALTHDGHTVMQACDGASARRLMRAASEPIDVILLDYRLPDSNDFQLLDDIRRLSPQSAVVMMTAHGDPDLTASALDHGAHRVLDKPFDLAVLDSVVRDAAA